MKYCEACGPTICAECPRVVSAPRTLEGALLWTIVDSSPGLIRHAALGGAASLDWTATRDAARSVGICDTVLTELLPALDYALREVAAELAETQHGRER